MQQMMAPLLTPVAPGVVGVSEHAGLALLQQTVELLAQIDGDPALLDVAGNDAARVDQLTLLERVKATAAAAQARITDVFERSQLSQQDAAIDEARAAGLEGRAERLSRNRGRGISDQVALARGCPISQGQRQLAQARALREMPHTNDLFREGRLSEWMVNELVRETDVLCAEDRGEVDRRLCAMTVDTKTGQIHDPEALGLTPHRAAGRARALAQELDAEAAVRRAAKATKQRRVTIRPTPTTMAYVTGLLPVVDGVAVIASLKSAATSAKARGDDRTISQLMADLFVQRITGHPTRGEDAVDHAGSNSRDTPGDGVAGDDQTSGDNDPGRRVDDRRVPVQVNLVMSAAAFTGGSEESARSDDGTPIPAGLARDWVHDPTTPVTIRRLLTDPVTGQVTELDPRRRHHSATDKEFFRLRDQICRMPGCDRPIEDSDHPVRHADGGESTRSNGQGLCEAHNLVKETPGWSTRVSDPRPGHHEVEITTPTGHVYRSQAPPALLRDMERADLPPPE